MSAIYEVTLDIDREIANEFLAWLRPHMQAVVVAGSFLGAELFREERDDGRLCLICHYRARSLSDINAYIANASAELRADGVNRFGTRFRASRRVLTLT